jgi:hypothetical protein
MATLSTTRAIEQAFHISITRPPRDSHRLEVVVKEITAVYWPSGAQVLSNGRSMVRNSKHSLLRVQVNWCFALPGIRM